MAIDTLGGSPTSRALAAYPTDGSAYNQAEITGTQLARILVQLDNSDITVTRPVGYGTVLPTGVQTGTVLQTSNPEPFVPNNIFPTLYPATNPGTAEVVEYQFCYMGSVFVDSSLNIGSAPRQRGDMYYLPEGTALILDETVNATTHWNRALMRRIPTHAQDIHVAFEAFRTTGGGSGRLTVGTGENNFLGVIGSGAITAPLIEGNEKIQMVPFSGSLSMSGVITGNATVRFQVSLKAYRETEW